VSNASLGEYRGQSPISGQADNFGIRDGDLPRSVSFRVLLVKRGAQLSDRKADARRKIARGRTKRYAPLLSDR
jgi:hypothetical protein